MTDTATPSPAPKLTEAERLRQQRAKIDARLAELSRRESTRRRRDETKAKIIVGALAREAGLVADLATKASERDREHLRALGWLSS